MQHNEFTGIRTHKIQYDITDRQFLPILFILQLLFCYFYPIICLYVYIYISAVHVSDLSDIMPSEKQRKQQKEIVSNVK